MEAEKAGERLRGKGDGGAGKGEGRWWCIFIRFGGSGKRSGRRSRYCPGDRIERPRRGSRRGKAGCRCQARRCRCTYRIGEPLRHETAVEIIDATEAEKAVRSDDGSVPLQDLSAVQAALAEPKTGYAYYQEAFRELFGDKKVILTQRDVTTAVLEGAAGGAALMGLLLVLLRPR